MHDRVSTWLTREEAAGYARVSVGTIDRWARDGLIVKYSVGNSRSVRFRSDEIDNVMIPEVVSS